MEDRLGEQLAARDLDAELALQPKDDVEEVDRLGPQGRPGSVASGVTSSRPRFNASTSVADTFV